MHFLDTVTFFCWGSIQNVFGSLPLCHPLLLKGPLLPTTSPWLSPIKYKILVPHSAHQSIHFIHSLSSVFSFLNYIWLKKNVLFGTQHTRKASISIMFELVKWHEQKTLWIPKLSYPTLLILWHLAEGGERFTSQYGNTINRHWYAVPCWREAAQPRSAKNSVELASDTLLNECHKLSQVTKRWRSIWFLKSFRKKTGFVLLFLLSTVGGQGTGIGRENSSS